MKPIKTHLKRLTDELSLEMYACTNDSRPLTLAKIQGWERTERLTYQDKYIENNSVGLASLKLLSSYKKGNCIAAADGAGPLYRVQAHLTHKFQRV